MWQNFATSNRQLIRNPLQGRLKTCATVRSKILSPVGFRLGFSVISVAYFLQFESAFPATEFLAAADFSHLAFFESRGVVYAETGQPQDALSILKRHGLNCVRLRLFTSSAAQALFDPYNYINNLDYTLPLAVRVKNAGLQFMLDFHYSDTWADPGHQRKPDAWTNLSFVQLVQEMHDYNSNTMVAFQLAGVMPDYVQVGNEITSGMLWPDGKVGGAYDSPNQWAQLGQLINAAVQGIRDASGGHMPKIIIHIDRGGDWSTTQWFFNNLRQQQVSFDMIGQSYYPFWHGPLASLDNCFSNTAARYQKPVFVAETAFPWTNSSWNSNIVGLQPDADGQVRYVAELASVVAHVPGSLAAGVFWWGAEYQPVPGLNEAGFSTASFFDSNGNVLPVVDALSQLTEPVKLSASLEGPVLKLNWPLSGAAASLKFTTNFAPGTQWLALTNQAVTNSTGFTLTLPITSVVSQFYQLQPK